jgi:hypothetical protein
MASGGRRWTQGAAFGYLATMGIENARAVNQLVHLDEELEQILTSFDSNYAWNYGSVKEGLSDLYEKAKREQWNGTEQLAWDTDVDPERGILPDFANPLIGYAPFDRLDESEKRRVRHGQISLQLSQFLHGEQGALIVASQLVGAVPWIDAKYYASTQTMDEARHVEVFGRYLREKLEWQWPVNDVAEGTHSLRDARRVASCRLRGGISQRLLRRYVRSGAARARGFRDLFVRIDAQPSGW